MIAMTSPRPRPVPRPPTAAPGSPPPVTSPPPAVDDEYTESLVVPAQIALGVVVAVAAGAILLALGLWPLAIVAVLVVAGAVYYLGSQVLTISSTRVSIGQGRGDNSPHTIELADVVAADAVTLTWPQCFGVGVPDTVDTTRFTVRAGPALSLTMRDGEQVRISSDDPQALLTRIGR